LPDIDPPAGGIGPEIGFGVTLDPRSADAPCWKRPPHWNRSSELVRRPVAHRAVEGTLPRAFQFRRHTPASLIGVLAPWNSTIDFLDKYDPIPQYY
jgi:hypothetical protein